MVSKTLLITCLVGLAAAKTDLSGCTSSQTTDQYGEASMIWFVPSSGEICAFLDCGGGTAPPKTTVPGCPLYSGTATYSPSFLANFASSTSATASVTSSASLMSVTSSASTSTSTSEDITILTGTVSATVSSSSSSSSGSSSTKTSTSSGSSSLTTKASTTAAPVSSSSTSSAAASSSTTSHNSGVQTRVGSMFLGLAAMGVAMYQL